MALKGIVVGDPHFCDYTPTKRIDDFIENQFSKLNKIKNIALEKDVDAVFLLGDVFDKARPAQWLVNRLIDSLRDFPCSVFSLVGNHDLQGASDGLAGTSLYTLFSSGILKRMEGDLEILGVPFRAINHGRNLSIDAFQTDTPRIILSHLMVTPQIAPFEHIYAFDVLKAAKDCFIFAGDFHDPFEFRDPINNSQIVNPGVLNRTSIAEKGTDPSVIYFEATPEDLVQQYRRISLGAPPGDKVFDVVSHEKTKTEELNLKNFIDSINQTQFESQDIEKLVLDVGKKSNTPEKIIVEAIERIKTAKALA